MPVSSLRLARRCALALALVAAPACTQEPESPPPAESEADREYRPIPASMRRELAGVWSKGDAKIVKIWLNGDIEILETEADGRRSRVWQPKVVFHLAPKVPSAYQTIYVIEEPPAERDGTWTMTMDGETYTLLSRDDYSIAPEGSSDSKAPTHGKLGPPPPTRSAPTGTPSAAPAEPPPQILTDAGAWAAAHHRVTHRETFDRYSGTTPLQGTSIETPAGLQLTARPKRPRIASQVAIVDKDGHKGLMLWGTTQARPSVEAQFGKPATDLRFRWASASPDEPIHGNYELKLTTASGRHHRHPFEGTEGTLVVQSPDDPITELWLGAPRRCGYRGIMFDDFAWAP
ncbi:MAG: hypothetical protein AAF799_24900 [Myxococcota bacterium]